MVDIPRREHPNPQFERAAWENLNGEWEFEIDKSASGVDRRLFEAEKLSGKILVPFCPESELSGVKHTDFLNSVWYKRNITIKDKSKRIVLHIGACDYFTTVYINAQPVGTHKGGYTSFSFDITDFVQVGDNTVVIHALDDNRSYLQPRGKQSVKYQSCNCDYTRTTGIWQTVWLEYIPETHLENVKYYPDAANSRLTVLAQVTGSATLTVTAYYEGVEVGMASARAVGRTAALTVELKQRHLWEPGHGRLYTLKLSYGEDTVKSYFGLRNVCLDGYKLMVNGKSTFLRAVLDQGYYPDGLYTAPSEEALYNDIQLALDAGFNGARLHEKVFEPRFLYHCDRMGYLVWGEYANWGLDHTELHALPTFLREWEEVLDRDFNHPAIIAWCPFNETWDINGKKQNDEVIEMVYRTTKRLDPTRPCIDTSGGYHVITDVFDYHDYTQDVEEFICHLNQLEKEDQVATFAQRRPYEKGEAVMLSEYGGLKWDVEGNIESWGYGDTPQSQEEFIARYRGLTEAIFRCKKIFGFCYTQLYDIEQEKNGLYTYSRMPKFDMQIFKEINSQKASIES